MLDQGIALKAAKANYDRLWGKLVDARTQGKYNTRKTKHPGLKLHTKKAREAREKALEERYGSTDMTGYRDVDIDDAKVQTALDLLGNTCTLKEAHAKLDEMQKAQLEEIMKAQESGPASGTDNPAIESKLKASEDAVMEAENELKRMIYDQ
jgi:hypothetical protein